MSKGAGGYENRKGKAKTPKFVMLSRTVLDTDAWHDLDCIARSLYVAVKYKYNGANNGSIGLGVREAGDLLNVSKSVAARAFSSLVDHGLVSQADKSAFNINGRRASTWRLTEAVDNRNNHPPSREFASWKPQNRKPNPSHQKQNVVPPGGQQVPPGGHGGIPLPKKAGLRPPRGTRVATNKSPQGDTYTSSHTQGPETGRRRDAPQTASASAPCREDDPRAFDRDTCEALRGFGIDPGSLVKKMEATDA